MYEGVYFYVVHTLNSVTKRSNTQLPEADQIDLKTNREGLKRKKNRCKFLSKRAFSYLYVVNHLASHVSFYLTFNKSEYIFPYVDSVYYTQLSRE